MISCFSPQPWASRLTPNDKESEVEDIRWKQRFDNYTNALQPLSRAVELSRQRDLLELEREG